MDKFSFQKRGQILFSSTKFLQKLSGVAIEMKQFGWTDNLNWHCSTFFSENNVDRF